MALVFPPVQRAQANVRSPLLEILAIKTGAEWVKKKKKIQLELLKYLKIFAPHVPLMAVFLRFASLP